jgi:Zn-dependent protease with chaperone function
VVPAAPGGAFAFGGTQRRIVVAAPLLERLTPAQQTALLAHERAHLRYRHDVYTRLARLSVAANPLLTRVAGAVDLAVERWADEVAVRETGDRRVVASALAVTALAHRGSAVPPSSAGLAAVGSDVVERVQLTMQPRQGRTLVCAAVLVVAMGTCWSAAALVVQHVHHLLELAELTRT